MSSKIIYSNSKHIKIQMCVKFLGLLFENVKTGLKKLSKSYKKFLDYVLSFIGVMVKNGYFF